MEQDLTQLSVKLLSNDSTGSGEVGNYFATKAESMIDIVREDGLSKDLSVLNIYI